MAKGNVKDASGTPVYRIPLAQITTSHNPRDPLGPWLVAEGYAAFHAGERPSLWSLATSEDAAQRAQYVDLIDRLELQEDGIKDLAAKILANGQLQPVEVRESGSGKYTIVFGVRRCLAIAYNACRGIGKPTVEARLTKANSVDALYRGLAENGGRKKPGLMETARAYQLQLNAGETVGQIAAREGCANETVANRLRLLELEPRDQRRVEAGTLKLKGALALLRGQVLAREPGARRPGKKQIAERLKTLTDEFLPEKMSEADRREVEILRWVLGL